jgi:flagellar basal body rod protein FlgG
MKASFSFSVRWVALSILVVASHWAIASIKALEPPVAHDLQPIVDDAAAGPLAPDPQALPARPIETGVPVVDPPPGSIAESIESERSGKAVLSPRQKEAWSVICEELPKASEEEKEIWFNQLGSLPSSVIRDILQHRNEHDELRLLERFTFDSMLTGLSPRSSVTMSMEATESERNQPPSIVMGRPILLPAADALLLAKAATCQNIANALSLGHKRIEIELIAVAENDDVPRLVWSNKESSAGMSKKQPFSTHMSVKFKRDLTPGPIEPASSQLAFAINGPGWLRCSKLQSRNETPSFYFLRTGICQQSSNSGLVIEQGGESYFLSSPLDTLSDQADIMTKFMRLELVEPPSHSGATSAAGDLGCGSVIAISTAIYNSTTEISVPPDPESPRNRDWSSHAAGKIVWGKMEGSNVDLEIELARLKKLDAMLAALGGI